MGPWQCRSVGPGDRAWQGWGAGLVRSAQPASPQPVCLQTDRQTDSQKIISLYRHHEYVLHKHTVPGWLTLAPSARVSASRAGARVQLLAGHRSPSGAPLAPMPAPPLTSTLAPRRPAAGGGSEPMPRGQAAPACGQGWRNVWPPLASQLLARRPAAFLKLPQMRVLVARGGAGRDTSGLALDPRTAGGRSQRACLLQRGCRGCRPRECRGNGRH